MDPPPKLTINNTATILHDYCCAIAILPKTQESTPRNYVEIRQIGCLIRAPAKGVSE